MSFWVPNYLGDAVNDVRRTRGNAADIVPEWYFLPFYAHPARQTVELGGVIAMFGAIVVLLFFVRADTSRVRSTKLPPDRSLVLLGIRFRRPGTGLDRLGSRRKATPIFWGRVFTV